MIGSAQRAYRTRPRVPPHDKEPAYARIELPPARRRVLRTAPAVLLPDAAARAAPSIGELARFPAETGPRPGAQANLHLTLAFLGNVGAAQEQALRAAAGCLRQPAFDRRLDNCSHWPGAGVVWLGCRREPHELLQLAVWLRDRAARNGCYQSSPPFHPHISLWRQATQPLALPPDTPGWTTRVSRFGLWLLAFDNGRVCYRLVQDWPLRRDGPQKENPCNSSPPSSLPDSYSAINVFLPMW